VDFSLHLKYLEIGPSTLYMELDPGEMGWPGVCWGFTQEFGMDLTHSVGGSFCIAPCSANNVERNNYLVDQLTLKDPWVFGCETTQNYPF
jgi:hypothetical protein